MLLVIFYAQNIWTRQSHTVVVYPLLRLLGGGLIEVAIVRCRVRNHEIRI